MIVLNVSFGIYAFLPQGWIFMIVIILIECLALSKLLSNKWKNKKIYISVIFSNFISGLLGIIGSMILNGGWWLVVWFPWVSEHEVNGSEAFKWLAILYLIAFVLTIIIEGIINVQILKRNYKMRKIVTNTLLINGLSYLIGSLAMYTYSF